MSHELNYRTLHKDIMLKHGFCMKVQNAGGSVNSTTSCLKDCNSSSISLNDMAIVGSKISRGAIGQITRLLEPY